MRPEEYLEEIMPGLPQAAPVLSTPDTHIFEESTSSIVGALSKRSDEEIFITYEIQRTVAEIRKGKWRRIALQFPDAMLSDAPRVFEALQRGLKTKDQLPANGNSDNSSVDDVTKDVEMLEVRQDILPDERLYILADTSYGACCVDEIAAEHVDADVVVHYGRACLSPTARLPVIHVFTQQPLDMQPLLQAFTETYPNLQERVVLMSDVTYSSHLPKISESLEAKGYSSVYTAAIVHNPSSPLPNRTVPAGLEEDEASLREWHLFHISSPPQSLLLTLSSRLSSIHIYPTDSPTTSPKPLQASTALALRRRYALLTSLSTASIFGILINTLSVKNYLHIVEHVKAQIAATGKKCYTFVVGKVNAAKIANFSEVDGWVVIGCWESSLVESGDFWKPVVTPFELEIALKGDGERVWTGEWTGDFQGILDGKEKTNGEPNGGSRSTANGDAAEERPDEGDLDSEPESAPPEFDLRTGRYVSHSRPMRSQDAPMAEPLKDGSSDASATPSHSLIKRAKGDLAIVGGEVSPGAEFLHSKRTWQGLGSDFVIAYDESGKEAGTAIEEGRSGIARGYTVGDQVVKR